MAQNPVLCYNFLMTNIRPAVEYLQEITNRTLSAQEFRELKKHVEERRYTRTDLDSLRSAVETHKDHIESTGIASEELATLQAQLETPHLYQSEDYLDTAAQSADGVLNHLGETRQSMDSVADRVIPIPDEIPGLESLENEGKYLRRGIAYATAGAAFYFLLYKPASFLLNQLPLIGEKENESGLRTVARNLLKWTGIFWLADTVIRAGDRTLLNREHRQREQRARTERAQRQVETMPTDADGRRSFETLPADTNLLDPNTNRITMEIDGASIPLEMCSVTIGEKTEVHVQVEDKTYRLTYGTGNTTINISQMLTAVRKGQDNSVIFTKDVAEVTLSHVEVQSLVRQLRAANGQAKVITVNVVLPGADAPTEVSLNAEPVTP